MTIIKYGTRSRFCFRIFLYKISTDTFQYKLQETRDTESGSGVLTLVSRLSTVITLPVSDGLLQHFVRQVVSG